MIRSMGNSGVIGGKIKMKAAEPVKTGSSFRINKTDACVAVLMNDESR